MTARSEELMGQVIDALATIHSPVVSGYVLGSRLFALLSDAELHEAKQHFDRLVASLCRVRLLTPVEGLGISHAYQVFGHAAATPAAVLCSLDPLAYVSHLSAMAYHGLTDRFSQVLYVTRPRLPDWSHQAKARMAKDLGSRFDAYLASGLPRLTQPSPKMIGGLAVHYSTRSQMGAFRNVPDSPIRVATLGRVFLDMLREPRLCGGIQHVIDIYRAEAPRYVTLIADEIDRHGQAIDKVRAGYLLTEVCKLQDGRLTSWQSHAQRGGSRKLDADEEYAAEYSARWMLSINVPSLAAASF